MKNEAEQEASEVLHSLLSVERVCGAEPGAGSSGEIAVIKAEINLGVFDKDDDEDRQNDTVDIETIEENSQKDINSYEFLLEYNDPNESSDAKDDSLEYVTQHLKKGCSCKGNCYKDLDAEHVYRHRLNIAELTREEHDMYLMGVTMASLSNFKKTSRQKDRQRHRATYVYQGKRVCLEAFLFLENVSLYQVKRTRDHVLKYGVVPRTHGNVGRTPHNRFSLDIYKNIEVFIKKCLEPYVTDFNRTQIVAGLTRADVYNAYKNHHDWEPTEKLAGYSTFRRFMKKQFPNIKFRKADFPTPKAAYLKKKSLATEGAAGGGKGKKQIKYEFDVLQ